MATPTLTLTVTMKKEAIIRAILKKFKASIDSRVKIFDDAAIAYALKHKDNRKLVEKYNEVDPLLKPLVNCTGFITFKLKKPELASGTERIYITIAPQFKLLDDAQPFGKLSGTYEQKVFLTSPVPLTNNAMVVEQGKEPKFLIDFLVYRKSILAQLQAAVKDLYHALYAIKNLKQLREHLPAMEQYFDIPDAQFTKMVPTEMYERVNNLIK